MVLDCVMVCYNTTRAQLEFTKSGKYVTPRQKSWPQFFIDTICVPDGCISKNKRMARRGRELDINAVCNRIGFGGDVGFQISFGKSRLSIYNNNHSIILL